jgi:hypothetical protein
MPKAQAIDWYMGLKDFAGPTATVFAACAAFFLGYRFGKVQSSAVTAQAAIALDKLKFDLFEKRYEIYSAAKELIEKVAHVRSLDKCNPDEIRSLYIKIDEARFFFPTEIQNHLQHIHDLSERLLRLVGQREMLKLNDQQWAVAADEIGGVSLNLHEIYGDLPKTFQATLAFKQVTQN